MQRPQPAVAPFVRVFISLVPYARPHGLRCTESSLRPFDFVIQPNGNLSKMAGPGGFNLGQRLLQLKDSILESLLSFFRAGRSAYIFICGLFLLITAGVILISTFESREARAAPPGWETFVAAAGSNQFVSCSFLLSSGCIVLSINYLPRLEGEG